MFWYKSKMHVLFEIMVQNKQKGGTGVESPPPRSFSGVDQIANMDFKLKFISIRKAKDEEKK